MRRCCPKTPRPTPALCSPRFVSYVAPVAYCTFDISVVTNDDLVISSQNLCRSLDGGTETSQPNHDFRSAFILANISFLQSRYALCSENNMVSREGNLEASAKSTMTMTMGQMQREGRTGSNPGTCLCLRHCGACILCSSSPPLDKDRNTRSFVFC